MAAGFAIGAYNASWQAVRVAQDQTFIAKGTLIASNRPWIKVTGLENTKVEVRNDSVIVTTNIGVKNVGSSPAPRTFIRTKLLPESSIIDDGREAEAACEDAVANGFPPFEALVFSNEAHGFFEVALIDMRAIKKNREGEIQKTYELNKPVFGEKFAQTHKAEAEAVPLRASLTLIGCAVYNIPVGQFAGQTAFVYGLNYNCGEGPFALCTFDMIRPAMYTGQDVKVREPVGGTFAR